MGLFDRFLMIFLAPGEVGRVVIIAFIVHLEKNMNTKNRILLLFVLALFGPSLNAQDTLILLNGKKEIVKSIELKDYEIAYRSLNKPEKLRRIDPERVFSVVYRDGTERVIYQKDSLDPIDFTADEMRMFVRGEQDAREFYRNRPIQALGLMAGVTSGMFGFYGILGPPIFSTFFGSFSPNVNKRLSFRIDGQAASIAGIETKKHLNNASGTVSNPQFSGEQLKINSHSITLQGPVDSAVARINGGFHQHLVHASSNGGKLNLYRSVDGSLISQNAYREGFEKRARDYKIRRSAFAGLVGFVAGSIAFTLLYNE